MAARPGARGPEPGARARAPAPPGAQKRCPLPVAQTHWTPRPSYPKIPSAPAPIFSPRAFAALGLRPPLGPLPVAKDSPLDQIMPVPVQIYLPGKGQGGGRLRIGGGGSSYVGRSRRGMEEKPSPERRRRDASPPRVGHGEEQLGRAVAQDRAGAEHQCEAAATSARLLSPGCSMVWTFVAYPWSLLVFPT